MRLIRIVAPHFVAGISESDIAPIIRYMRLWPDDKIWRYCKSKGWAYESYPH